MSDTARLPSAVRSAGRAHRSRVLSRTAEITLTAAPVRRAGHRRRASGTRTALAARPISVRTIAASRAARTPLPQ
ncbi:hypothetical protein GCM10009818_03390 [Nakamurella flavida]